MRTIERPFQGHVKSRDCLGLTRKENFCLASAVVSSLLLLASPLAQDAVPIEA